MLYSIVAKIRTIAVIFIGSLRYKVTFHFVLNTINGNSTGFLNLAGSRYDKGSSVINGLVNLNFAEPIAIINLN